MAIIKQSCVNTHNIWQKLCVMENKTLSCFGKQKEVKKKNGIILHFCTTI